MHILCECQTQLYCIVIKLLILFFCRSHKLSKKENDEHKIIIKVCIHFLVFYHHYLLL